jgi:hypothetical protein
VPAWSDCLKIDKAVRQVYTEEDGTAVVHTYSCLMKGHSHPNRDAQLLRTVGKVVLALTTAYLTFVGSKAWLRPSQAVTPLVVDLDWIRSSHEVCSLAP